MNKNIKINDIKREAGLAINSVHPTYKQLNAAREALASLIERIPANERTSAENALLTQHSDIEAKRLRSNELEEQAELAQSDEELDAIEISF